MSFVRRPAWRGSRCIDEKQKKGKRRMKMIGSVEVPQEAFMALLSLGDEE